MNLRIIPRLDIKGPNLVKGIHLEGLRVMGKPELFAKHYYESGADELLFMDIVASLYQRNNILDVVSNVSKAIFIPLTVGGGLRTLSDIKAALRAGADKVSLNTGAINNPNLIKEASKAFGSSTIVISIEAKKNGENYWEAYTDNGREKTGLDALEWAQQVVEYGAGEIIVTSIDKEGTGNGFEIELVKKISENVSIPVIACGGAGNKLHVADLLEKANPDAVSIASLFHYNFLNEYKSTESIDPKLANYSINSFSKIDRISIKDLKDYLRGEGFNLRN